jgi:hypothetical protein
MRPGSSAGLFSGAGRPGVFAPMDAAGTAPEAARRVKDWTAKRFGLGDSETIVVTQVVPTLPGFPPAATWVAFWTREGARHHFRLYKPVAAIVEDDLPPRWLLSALADDEGCCPCC